MLKKILKYLLIGFLIIIILFGLFLTSVYHGVFGPIHTIEELKEFKNQTATLVLSEEGELLGKFFAENRTNIKYEQIPKHLVDALVATEDARYFEHDGVDSRSLLRVIFKTILFQDKNSGGGSTINQQLVKNMYGRKNHGPLSMLVNKSKEAFLAYRLEKIYSKEDILTLYLNTVPFGENVLGVEAASRRFFNKPIEEIKIEEAAILVGMLKANTYYNPRIYPDNAIQRRNVVLTQMEKYEYITPHLKDSLQEIPLQLDYANLESEGPANYFLVQVKDEVKKILKEYNSTNGTNLTVNNDELIITTTLNLHLQNQALNAFKNHLSVMQNRLRKQYRTGNSRKVLNKLVSKELERLKLTTKADEKLQRELFSWDGIYTDSVSIRDSLRHSLTLLHAGLLALDPQTGAVKTWVGGIDFGTQPYDQIFAQRQVASTFKPILYAEALEQGITPCSYLDNKTLIISDFGNWQPSNYDNSTGGNYSMAAALAKSMNIPTVNLFLNIPFGNLEKLWKGLGFTQELPKKPSVALGTANSSIYELSKAYSAFANGGYLIQPKTILSIKTSNGKVIYNNKLLKPNERERVISRNTSILLTKMLEKAINEGTGTSLKNKYGINIPIAGKTGTSQDYADAWFAAYTPKLVVVTRVGASSPSIRFNSGTNGSGSKLALPLVGKTLQNVQKKYSTSFAPLPEQFADALDCEDFLEDSKFNLFFENLFGKDNTTLEKEQRRAKRKAEREKRRAERKAKRNNKK
ncbi:transglycosylase domain-containing protein [Aureibaculum sp. 2210JD6-5]|uniref:transglycosylase domain-containing protein n=1 Tax=Aureibaculum sp. 2210JD6-5 TaxID=3103957 RepID=UPI002AADB29D|nr:transglycosylase domain-containing protein [Aureibaculum sp. 2210JD6-5]MDY7395385.1 transglycosylase domain-containing protein [Aureibaculum sp. 2210JD6-5]